MNDEMSSRDRHLFGPGPKRILSLDGGGVRGAITIAFLERIEKLLSANGKVRLCDHFDLIGGTSTGAIIATALALGHSAADVHEFYMRMGPRAFQHNSWRVIGLQAKFDSTLLQKELDTVIADRTLDTPDLLTGLAVVTKRMDTGSPWIISNNPRAHYWQTPEDNSYIGNHAFKLAHLVRASTAAPHYFDPEMLMIADGAPPGLFVDGGVSPHNNPALQLLLMAALDGFGLRWPLGRENLSILSVGTGSHRRRLTHAATMRLPSAALAVHALTGLVADTQTHALTLLHWLSGTHPSSPINSEIGMLAKDGAPFATPLFGFQRYDVQLETDWLKQELGLAIADSEITKLRLMDDPDIIPRAYEIGQVAAERLVDPADFSPNKNGG